MEQTDLVFWQTPATGNPVALVFGDDGAPATQTYSASAVGSISGLAGTIQARCGVRLVCAGSISGLAGGINASIDLNVARPTVGRTVSLTQHAQPISIAERTADQQAAPLPAAVQAVSEEASGLRGTLRTASEQALALRAAAWMTDQQARPLPAWVRAVLFEDAARLRTGATARFEQGALARAARTQRFEDAERLRDGRRSRFEPAQRLHGAHLGGAGYGRPVRLRQAGRYQEGMPPPPGIWIRPGPQPEDPCYVPPDGDAVHLLFKEAWSDDTNLLFVCERHGPGPEPGETVVVPIKEVYLVINSAVLIRVDGGTIIPTTAMSMSLDVDSWTWGFSASVPGYALADVEPEGGAPVAVQATVNGTAYRFIVESISRERVFGRNDLRIGGRGRAAVLDAPYAPIMSFMNTGARTAQQIMNDILTDNGVPLGWGVEWNPDDWNVPAGVFAHQGSYITALNQVAGSIAAYLQPHNTDETLRVLSRYPVAPWEWGNVTPDFDLPSAVTTREGIEWVNKARYNRVYVMGQQTGVNGRVTRAGTAGDYLAPSVVDPLITEAVAARQRGLAVLSDTGRIASVSLRLPVLAETGIIKPGNFVRYTDGGTERIGITRSVQVEVGLPSIWQTIGVETHVEPV